MTGAADNFYDVIVVGGGPAGLTAALYLARARYRVLVLEQETFGGQITITEEVVNYPGIVRASGESITAGMRRQAESFGAELLLAEVKGLSLDGDVKSVRTSRGDFESFGVVIATGAHPRKIGFPGEEEFQGRGVAYCATCDGEFFTGLDVFVVGGSFAAAEEAVFLTKFARKVHMLVRRAELTCARQVADAALNHPKIEVHFNSVLEGLSGGATPDRARIKNTATGEVWEYSPPAGERFGVFVFAGYVPSTGLVQGALALDPDGYILTDENRRTDIAGVYAAGDVCVKNLRQMVTAAADGAIAATELEKHCYAMQEKTGRVPRAPEATAATPPPDGAAQGAAPGQVQGAEQAQGQEGFFSAEIRAQLQTLFGKMQQPLVLKAALDDREVSGELRGFLSELTGMTDKLSWIELTPAPTPAPVDAGAPTSAHATILEERPCVGLFLPDGTDTGLAFHGVPGGHEFNSFVVGLYNAAGPGQPLDEDSLRRIRSIDEPTQLRVFVSLSCTMCPETVMSAQRIASLHPDVRVDVYDLNHFPALREQYQVMSVPCMVCGDQVSFGKKNVEQVLEFLGR
ncbi:MAG: FAD-dependent oxidoreductase [Clostridiales Family XIII bacterium]|nr:FAD-dependent oxidoreductase [Clostridiales Family XIII bacterium]